MREIRYVQGKGVGKTTVEPLGSVLYRAVSSFQRHIWDIAKCLNTEVSLFQGMPLRGVPQSPFRSRGQSLLQHCYRPLIQYSNQL